MQCTSGRSSGYCYDTVKICVLQLEEQLRLGGEELLRLGGEELLRLGEEQLRLGGESC